MKVTRPGGKNGDMEKSLNKTFSFCWIFGGIKIEIPTPKEKMCASVHQIKENSWVILSYNVFFLGGGL